MRQEQEELQDKLFKATRATGEHAKVSAQVKQEQAHNAEKGGETGRVPLSELLKQEEGKPQYGGFVSEGLAVESEEGVQSNVVAAGVVTGLAAVKAGLGATAAVKAATEGVAAALKNPLKEKRVGKTEFENMHKRKKLLLQIPNCNSQ